MAMHDDELPIDDGDVEALVAEQFREWAGLPVRRLSTDGTVNAIFRIGDGLAARFPLQHADPDAARSALETEARAMQELGDTIPFPTPRPIALGRPGPGYPLPWSVQTWLDGDLATPAGLEASDAFAGDLVDLIAAMRAADMNGRTFDGRGRGGDLRDSDEWVETCFSRSETLVPVPRLRALWAALRELPPIGADVMSHRDLIPGNLLVTTVSGEGRLAGVLDGGSFGPADRALDLVAGWHLLDRPRRAILRTRLEVGEIEWLRGAAWALEQSIGLVWYYETSNPGMAALGRSTLARLLADPALGEHVDRVAARD